VNLKNVLAVALGILSAIGGFVDIGDLVFNTQAGATFGFQLLWVVVLGVVGIIVYSEMCGRVAAVAKRPVFDLVRERVGFGAGLSTLIASQVVNLMTCAAEIGGVAICLQLLSGLPYRLLIPLAVAGLAVASWVLPFEWIERVFGYLGLCLLVFAVAAIKLHPDWGKVASGFVPGSHSGGSLMVYLYFVVGLLGAAMTPYEVYFYSSGAVEDWWGLQELGLNKVTSMIGYGLGGFLSLALMIVAGTLFLPLGIDPQFLGTPALASADALGAYQGTVGVARRSWAREHDAALVGFIRAYLAATHWLYDRANREIVEAILIANVRDMTPALAKQSYDLLLGDKGGLSRDLAPDLAGMRTVLRLRGKFGSPPKTLTDPMKYVDLSYREKALGKP